MAFGKKKESREVEGYMKLTPKSALIYLAIIVFCIIVISRWSLYFPVLFVLREIRHLRCFSSQNLLWQVTNRRSVI